MMLAAPLRDARPNDGAPGSKPETPAAPGLPFWPMLNHHMPAHRAAWKSDSAGHPLRKEAAVNQTLKAATKEGDDLLKHQQNPLLTSVAFRTGRMKLHPSLRQLVCPMVPCAQM